MRKTCAISIVLLIAAVLKAGAPVAPAQGWKICRGGAYEVRVPSDWACSYDQATGKLVSVSVKENIQFIGSSRLVKAGERLPVAPTRLKEYLSNRFDLINSTRDGRFAITTENIAVETINGLRGVVAELILSKPAVKKDGTPFLVRLGGFVLVAERDNARYSALILCPLERFTYNSAVMNRVINDIRPVNQLVEAARQEHSELEGVWRLSDAENKYRISLYLKGDAGALKVAWRDARGEAFLVGQRVVIRRESYGVLVIGSTPAYLSNNITRPPYAADTFLFQWQGDGSFKVWVCDNVYVKEWKPLHVESRTPLWSLHR